MVTGMGIIIQQRGFGVCDSMQKKILVLTTDYPPLPYPGGVAESVRRISSALASEEYEITIITLQEMGSKVKRPHLDLTETYHDGRLEVIKLFPPERRDHYSPSEFAVSLFEWISDYVEKENFDLIHSFYISSTGYLAGLVAKENNIPHICSVRGNDLHKDIFNSSKLSNIVWVMQNADILTFVSDDLCSRAKNLFSPKGKTRVIWNGIDPGHFCEDVIIPDAFLSLTRPVIGLAGYIRRKKGLETLLDACARINKNVTLLIIGELREIEREYWEKLIFPSIASNINLIVTGMIPHTQILKYYHLLDLLVIPSTHDGCPNVLLEAMLAGVPIISTRKGAMKEILTESEGGLFVSVNNSAELSEKIQYLLDNPHIAISLTQNARGFLMDKLSIQAEALAWKECYHSLL